ncbi:MAG: thiol reductant ABC exporter subunit CydC [Hyphomicrobium sp.]|uniref:thiol reductant ABC exporter subunit CydC n=1 Tax=Hyphomicrobium sp. TaxID=82 RepID=UPI0039E48964
MIEALKPILVLFWQGPRAKLLSGLLLSAATIASGLALLGLSGWFITATAVAGATAASALAFDVFSPSAGIRFFALARTASRYGERLVTHDATLGVLAELRERLFRGSAAVREAEKLRMRPAKLLFRLTQDIDALDSLYLRVLVPIGAAIISAVAVAVIFGLLSPNTGAAAGLLLLFAGLGIAFIAARIAERPSRRRAFALEALRSRVIDLVSGQTELVMAGQIGAQRRNILEQDRKLAAADDRLNIIESLSGAGFGIASAILVASALLLATAAVHANAISGPVAALVVLVSIAALEPFNALRRGAIEFGRTINAARHVGSRLAPFNAASVPTPEEGVACSIESVSVKYANAARPLISDLSLLIPRGERCAIVGVSGSGKSTLMALIAGEISPDCGSVRRLPATLLTQRTELFADTLRDNLRLASANANDARLRDAISCSGLKPYLDALPNGLDTHLGEGGLGLSGGEARRLALARLFLRDTPLWLLDEPTEGLDAATARDVIGRVADNANGRTLLIATHIRLEAEIADRLLVMERGRIVASADRGDPQFNCILATLRHD